VAAKDAHLTRGPVSQNTLFLGTFDALLITELTATPAVNGRAEEITIVENMGAVLIPELTATPHDATVVIVTPGDQLPPQVSNFTAAGTLAGANAPISFDITDVNPGVGLVLVSVLFEGATEPALIYSGAQFEGAYAAFSTVVAIVSGFRFKLLRAGGWPANITSVWIYTADQAGEVGALP